VPLPLNYVPHFALGSSYPSSSSDGSFGGVKISPGSLAPSTGRAFLGLVEYG
jgi:hypothetical protein